MQRALEVPAEERLGRHDVIAEPVRERALHEIEALVEVAPRVHRERPRHPEIVERVLDRLPVPPSSAPAGRPGRVEVGVAHRALRTDGRLDLAQHPGVAFEPPGPAGVADAIVEHGAPPPRQRRRRHEAGRVRPVLEQQPALVDEPIEPRAIVRAEAAPHGQVVRALQHVDGVHLDPAHVLDEAREPSLGQPRRARPRQVLSLEKERANGRQRGHRVLHRQRHGPRLTDRSRGRWRRSAVDRRRRG